MEVEGGLRTAATASRASGRAEPAVAAPGLTKGAGGQPAASAAPAKISPINGDASNNLKLQSHYGDI